MTTPRLCVTVTGSTMAELRARRDAVVEADLVEVRLDSVADPDPAGALADRRRPVVVTCRPAWEGGGFTGAEEERLRILAEALALGAEYVDVEARATFGSLMTAAGGKRIVLSFHDFEGMTADLSGRLRAMRATGAEVVKLAVKARRLSDCLTLLQVAREQGPDAGVVLLAMGPQGLATRVLAGRFGSRWTYAGELAGVGQVGAAELLDRYGFRRLTDATDLYGVVGSPITHSVSPAMHNAAFRAAGLDAVYLPLPAADADDFLDFAHGMGVKGASVTIPFKIALAERVQGMDAVAHRIGAVNTVRAMDGRWLGANSDVNGFLRPLQDRGISVRGLRASILGAGGAARAVAIALQPSGAAVQVHARNPASAADVAMMVSGTVGPWPPAPGTWDLLVNCTPIGMHPRTDSPVPPDALTGALVYDLIYNPPTTTLLRDAAAAGCQTIGGLAMLVAQAHEQFLWWTGLRPSPGVMRAAAERRLAEFTADEAHLV